LAWLGLKRSEMPLIERQQPIGAVATGKNDHRGIRKADGSVSVIFHDHHRLSQGVDVKGFQTIRTSDNFLQQEPRGPPPNTFGQKIVKLGQDKWG
jgi:hypothetical protein